MKYEIGKKIVSAGITALFLGSGGVAYAGKNVEEITSPALRKQLAEVQYTQVAGSEYLANACDCCDCCDNCCDSGCDCTCGADLS